MRKIIVFTVLGVIVLGLTAAVAADTATKVRADVPFAFYAGKELIPAGSYIFELRSFGMGSSASSVLIHNESGSIVTVLLTKPGDVPLGEDAHLHFNKYGVRHFLSKVEGAGYQANLTPSRAEKEMRAQAQSSGQSIVAGVR